MPRASRICQLDRQQNVVAWKTVRGSFFFHVFLIRIDLLGYAHFRLPWSSHDRLERTVAVGFEHSSGDWLRTEIGQGKWREDLTLAGIDCSFPVLLWQKFIPKRTNVVLSFFCSSPAPCVDLAGRGQLDLLGKLKWKNDDTQQLPAVRGPFFGSFFGSLFGKILSSSTTFTPGRSTRHPVFENKGRRVVASVGKRNQPPSCSN